MRSQLFLTADLILSFVLFFARQKTTEDGDVVDKGLASDDLLHVVLTFMVSQFASFDPCAARVEPSDDLLDFGVAG